MIWPPSFPPSLCPKSQELWTFYPQILYIWSALSGEQYRFFFLLVFSLSSLFPSIHPFIELFYSLLSIRLLFRDVGHLGHEWSVCANRFEKLSLWLCYFLNLTVVWLASLLHLKDVFIYSCVLSFSDILFWSFTQKSLSCQSRGQIIRIVYVFWLCWSALSVM